MSSRYALPHVTAPLLSKSVITRAERPALFEFALDNRTALEKTLQNIGMSLVVNTTQGILQARAMTDAEMDAYAERHDCDPIPRWMPPHKLSFWESVAALYFRDHLDQEIRQGGHPLRMKEEEVIDALARQGMDNDSDDKLATRKRALTIIERLINYGLLERGGASAAPTYRGTALLAVAFTRDNMDELRASLTALLAQHAQDATQAATPECAPSAPTSTQNEFAL